MRRKNRWRTHWNRRHHELSRVVCQLFQTDIHQEAPNSEVPLSRYSLHRIYQDKILNSGFLVLITPTWSNWVIYVGSRSQTFFPVYLFRTTLILPAALLNYVNHTSHETGETMAGNSCLRADHRLIKSRLLICHPSLAVDISCPWILNIRDALRAQTVHNPVQVVEQIRSVAKLFSLSRYLEFLLQIMLVSDCHCQAEHPLTLSLNIAPISKSHCWSNEVRNWLLRLKQGSRLSDRKDKTATRQNRDWCHKEKIVCHPMKLGVGRMYPNQDKDHERTVSHYQLTNRRDT